MDMAKTMESPAKPKERLFSLDLLRGIDMFLLTGGIGGVMIFVCNHVGLEEWGAYHIGHHAPWIGFSFWDIIMPLFIFMCGASVPLALEKRLAQGKKAFWKHVAGRFALLWLCGLCVQGNLLSYDIAQLKPYSNTLQSIAVGYLVAAIVLTFRRRWLVPAVAVALAAAYALLLHLFGDYTQNGNFAYFCELKILRAFWPEDSAAVKTVVEHGYTWFLTSMMFGAMTLCGMHCTYVLTGSCAPWRKVWAMSILGVGLLAAGFALQPWIPRIKHIFTLTFTAQAMGYSVLAWAALYALTDIWRFRKGLGFLILFGQNALFAYMVTHIFGRFPYSISQSFYGGLEHFFTPEGWKEWLPLIRGLFNMATMIFLLRYWVLVKKVRSSGVVSGKTL